MCGSSALDFMWYIWWQHIVSLSFARFMFNRRGRDAKILLLVCNWCLLIHGVHTFMTNYLISFISLCYLTAAAPSHFEMYSSPVVESRDQSNFNNRYMCLELTKHYQLQCYLSFLNHQFLSYWSFEEYFPIVGKKTRKVLRLASNCVDS